MESPSFENSRPRNTGMENLRLGHFALTEEEKRVLTPEEQKTRQKRLDEANARLMNEKAEEARRSLEVGVARDELEKEAREKLRRVFGGKKETTQ